MKHINEYISDNRNDELIEEGLLKTIAEKGKGMFKKIFSNVAKAIGDEWEKAKKAEEEAMKSKKSEDYIAAIKHQCELIDKGEFSDKDKIKYKIQLWAGAKAYGEKVIHDDSTVKLAEEEIAKYNKEDPKAAKAGVNELNTAAGGKPGAKDKGNEQVAAAANDAAKNLDGVDAINIENLIKAMMQEAYMEYDENDMVYEAKKSQGEIIKNMLKNNVKRAALAKFIGALLELNKVAGKDQIENVPAVLKTMSDLLSNDTINKYKELQENANNNDGK